jgi:hypothetical protein
VPDHLDSPALARDEYQLLARLWLTPVDASGESDHPRSTTGATATARTRSPGREPRIRRDVLFGGKWSAAGGCGEPVRAAPGKDKTEG